MIDGALRATRTWRKAATVLLAAGTAALLLSCDSGDATRDFTGVWNAEITVTGGASAGNQFPVTITLWQDRQDVHGTFANEAGTITGTIDGFVRGEILYATFSQAPPCPGEFEGTAAIRADGALVANYQGVGCTGWLSAELVAWP